MQCWYRRDMDAIDTNTKSYSLPFPSHLTLSSLSLFETLGIINSSAKNKIKKLNIQLRADLALLCQWGATLHLGTLTRHQAEEGECR